MSTELANIKSYLRERITKLSPFKKPVLLSTDVQIGLKDGASQMLIDMEIALKAIENITEADGFGLELIKNIKP